MVNLHSTLLALATITLAHPSSPTPPSLQPRALQGSCSTTYLPTEDQYDLGYQTFCETYLPASGSKPITQAAPLVATVNMTAYNGQPIRWVYKVSGTDTTPLTPRYELTRETCVAKFKSVLETADAGGLGKAYCVVDGTGGDKVGEAGMSGQGVVLVKGGNVSEGASDGDLSVSWETRARAGG